MTGMATISSNLCDWVPEIKEELISALGEASYITHYNRVWCNYQTMATEIRSVAGQHVKTIAGQLCCWTNSVAGYLNNILYLEFIGLFSNKLKRDVEKYVCIFFSFLNMCRVLHYVARRGAKGTPSAKLKNKK